MYCSHLTRDKIIVFLFQKSCQLYQFCNLQRRYTGLIRQLIYHNIRIRSQQAGKEILVTV